MRTSPMDLIEALLGIQSDGTIHGYLQPSLADLFWQNLQETHKLREPSVCREKLEWMIICQLDTFVVHGCTWNVTSVRGKGKQRAKESDSDSEEQLV